MPVLSIGECIKFGWETFKRRPWILIGGFLITMLVPSIPISWLAVAHAYRTLAAHSGP
jgi:hypothetical protein